MKNLLIESWAKRYSQTANDIISEAEEEDDEPREETRLEKRRAFDKELGTDPHQDSEDHDRMWYHSASQEEKDRSVIDRFKATINDWPWKFKASKWAIIYLFFDGKWDIFDKQSEDGDKEILKMLKNYSEQVLNKPYDALGLSYNSWKTEEEIHDEDEKNRVENVRKRGGSPTYKTANDDLDAGGWWTSDRNQDLKNWDPTSETLPEDDFENLVKILLRTLEATKSSFREFDFSVMGNLASKIWHKQFPRTTQKKTK